MHTPPSLLHRSALCSLALTANFSAPEADYDSLWDNEETDTWASLLGAGDDAIGENVFAKWL